MLKRMCVAAAVAAVAPLAAQPARVAASDSSLASVFDAELPRLLERHGVPGAIVTLVRGDRVILSRGYGFADAGGRVPVDPQATVFRVASVAKVFTALAVLHAAEEGRISLAADVQQLAPGISLPPRPGDTVTLHHLLTHTAGIDDQNLGYLAPAGERPAPLADYLSTHMPKRPRPAGSVPGYSNHGYAVAGRVLEVAYEQPFEQLMTLNLFAPLGMTRTTIVMNPTRHEGLAREYRSNGDIRIPRVGRPVPAGNLGTTGADMGRFLTALQRARNGRSTGPVSPTVVARMIGPAVSYHPALPPMGYGFSGIPFGADTLWVKGGASPSHSAVVAVAPSLDAAFFVAVNRQEPALWSELIDTLAQRFAEPRVAVASNLRTEAVTGDYVWTRAPLSSFEKFVHLAVQLRVSAAPEGISISGNDELNGVWRPGNGVYQRADGRVLAFRPGANGRAEYAFSTIQGQPFSFERIPAHRTTRVQLGVLLGGAIAATGAALAAFRGRRGGAAVPLRRWSLRAIYVLPLLVAATFASAVGLSTQGDALQEGPTNLLRLTLLLAMATATLGILQAAAGTHLARTSGPVMRGILVVGAAGGLAIAWFLTTNHMYGWPV